MKLITPKEVGDHYRQESLVQEYISRRFSDPLNIIEHQRQVSILNKIINENQCQQVLEFAPGPARVTAELEIDGGTSIDASAEMLEIAKARMRQRGKSWTFLQQDLFKIPTRMKKKYDLIFAFRFFLHFQKEHRQILYQRAFHALPEGGYLVFEAMNRRVAGSLRKILGEKRYFVFDKLYSRKELAAELEENGFGLVRLYPVLNHFWLQALCSRPFKLLGWLKKAEKSVVFFERFLSQQPYEWVVLAQKKNVKEKISRKK